MAGFVVLLLAIGTMNRGQALTGNMVTGRGRWGVLSRILLSRAGSDSARGGDIIALSLIGATVAPDVFRTP